MRSAGITLILAGIALIGAIGFDIMKQERTAGFAPMAMAGTRQLAVTRREAGSVRWFTALGTILIIAGVSAAVVGKKDKGDF